MTVAAILPFVRALRIGHQAYFDVDVPIVPAGARGSTEVTGGGAQGFNAAIYHTIMFDGIPPNVFDFTISGRDFSPTSIRITPGVIGQLVGIWAFSTTADPIRFELENLDPIAAHAFRFTLGLIRFATVDDMKLVRLLVGAQGLGVSLRDIPGVKPSVFEELAALLLRA